MSVSRHRILVTARQVERFAGECAEALARTNTELVFPEMPRPQLTEDELLEVLPGCSGVIAMPDAYTARVLRACAPRLRIIARAGVGFDSIDLDAANELGVWVTTTPGSNHETVADYTLGLILCLLRDLVGTATRTRSGTWQRMQGQELSGKALGVIGTGRVGKAVIRRAQAFGMHTLAFDAYPDVAWATVSSVHYVTFDALLAQSDVVTLHAPASPETRSLLNEQTLQLCKPGCWIVNTARGELIDEQALKDALDRGHIAGAALDVFRKEPPADWSLVEHPRVLPFSHSAGGTVEAHRRAALMAIEEVLRVVSGQTPQFAVNKPQIAAH
ncbi:MAG: phosphoglycerate dehydrogenase [Chloroflexi bacterium]|nr:phosphoglycerate dehydrogenase [Chloroflexota bacterium]